MAFKLTKMQSNILAPFVEQADTAHQAVDHAIQAFNEVRDEAWETLQDAITTYNDAITDAFMAVAQAEEGFVDALSDLKSTIDEMVSDWESDFSDKSERWQEGEKGEAARAFIDAWADLDLEAHTIEEPEPVTVDEMPEIEWDFGLPSDVINDLPTEAE